MRKFNYYIVYIFGNVVGTSVVELNFKIKDWEHIKDIADYISKESCNNKQVLILNWKRIRKG